MVANINTDEKEGSSMRSTCFVYDYVCCYGKTITFFIKHNGKRIKLLNM